MHRLIGILCLLVSALLLMTSGVPLCHAAGDAETEAALEDPDPKRSDGRFQALRVDDASVFILDTREGHFWLWRISKVGTLSLLYGGHVRPAATMGEVIDRVPIKPREKGETD